AAITTGTALSGTQLNATANVAGTFAYSPAAGTTPVAGTPTLGVTFTPTDTANYTLATGSVSLVVGKATPVITWATPAAITTGTALSGTQLNATANVAGTFVYNPATGSTPATGLQTLSVTFTPADPVNYTSATASVPLAVGQLPSPPVITSVVVGYQQATVTFTAPADDGGLGITVYTVTATPTGLTPTSGTLRALATRGKGPAAATAGIVVVTGTRSPITVTGLVDGVTYSFAVSAANSLGASVPSAPSDPVMVVAAAPTRLSNLSVRIGAGTGDRTLIVGFVVGGAGTSGAKPLLIRGVGPTLASYGVAGTLVDPSLALIPQGSSTALAANDNWGGDAQLTAVGNTVGAFPLSSAASKDAALYLTPASGVYTVQVTGVGGATGIALAEIYDASGSDCTASTPRLINVSARAQVGTGDGVLIAGFVVEGTASRTVLIRAVGPTLATYGVGGVLADPQLELTQAINGANVVVATNDNWAGDAQITSVANTVGAFALSGAASKDAAILVTLPPGIYTAKASGAAGSTGVALIEVYEVP
ncbi:MAG: fibronectin type III domain-containing protein, partial [Verrucomicrobiota bacterium]